MFHHNGNYVYVYSSHVLNLQNCSDNIATSVNTMSKFSSNRLFTFSAVRHCTRLTKNAASQREK